jgi:hypothetical protein
MYCIENTCFKQRSFIASTSAQIMLYRLGRAMSRTYATCQLSYELKTSGVLRGGVKPEVYTSNM